MRSKKADVLVVGSGMGGMSAAALLAKDGYRVFVAEKTARIGGRCATLECNGFKCTSGVLAIELNGIVQGLFESIGAPFDVVAAGPLNFRINGKLVQGKRTGGMKSLLEATGGGQDSVEKIMSSMSKAINWKGPSPGITLGSWLRQYTDHRGIIDLFQALVGTIMMVKVDEVPAQYFFKLLSRLKGASDFGFCATGSGALPEGLGRIVLQHGGEIWTDSRVDRIVVDDGVVQGAILKHQEKAFFIEAQVVISDTGPKKTVELAGEPFFDPDYLQELETKLEPTTAICLQVGLKKPLFEGNNLLLTDAKRVHALYQPTAVCPDLAPEGRHLLVVNALPNSAKVLGSEAGRQHEIDLCFEDIRAAFPQFKRSGTILPTTLYKDFWPGMHSWPGRDMPLKTPIINLYNVGDGVKKTGYSGLPAVVNSGMRVAEEVRRRMPILNGIAANSEPPE